MIELIIGAAVGAVGGAAVSSKMNNGENSEKAKLNREVGRLDEENEKLRNRLKAAERQIEDLLSANKRLRNEAKTVENDSDDLEDELSSVKLKMRSLTRQNEDLLRQLEEYKQVCSSYEAQLRQYKQN